MSPARGAGALSIPRAWASWSHGCLPPQRAVGRRRFLTEAARRNGLTVRLARFWVGHLQQRQWGEGIATGGCQTPT
jgi:hypothetical protein